MTKCERITLYVTGIFGILAALIVGTGEFLLHFDPLSRFSEATYVFMTDIPNNRQTLGHFIAVLGSPLYLIGCWHIYLMLKPASKTWAFIAFIISSYGFIIGGDWISSRASIGAIIHLQDNSLQNLIKLYDLRYESLLSIIRVTTSVLSVIFVLLVLSNKSHYRKWHAIFNPIVLLLLSFLLYVINPDLGKYIMPIALNVAFGIFFLLSTLQIRNIK
ncbi:MAG: hypothetical protein COA66_06865 [Arcobacter sp.]|nr:MAG: hypothetical protein COA66_06865 [Arcobacter sp.]